MSNSLCIKLFEVIENVKLNQVDQLLDINLNTLIVLTQEEKVPLHIAII